MPKPYARINGTTIEQGYIFLDAVNVIWNISIMKEYKLPTPMKYNLSDVYPLHISDKIYINGKSEIYIFDSL